MNDEIKTETLTIKIKIKENKENMEDWIIKLISKDNLHRLLHDKNEILVLNKHNHIVFHAIYGEEYINIINKEEYIMLSIKNNEMVIYKKD